MQIHSTNGGNDAAHHRSMRARQQGSETKFGLQNVVHGLRVNLAAG